MRYMYIELLITLQNLGAKTNVSFDPVTILLLIMIINLMFKIGRTFKR